MKRCILVQGPSDSTYIDKIKLAWSGYPIVWSCWEGDEKYYTHTDVVIFNKPYSGFVKERHTLQLQRVTTLNGIIKAKELGYDRVFKWRSDMIPTNSDELINSLDTHKLNIHSYHKDGYMLDFYMEGDVIDLVKLWAFEYNHRFPEQGITEQLFANGLNKKVHCLKDFLRIENDIIWMKRNSRFSNNIEGAYLNTFPYPYKVSNKKFLNGINFIYTQNGEDAILKLNLFK